MVDYSNKKPWCYILFNALQLACELLIRSRMLPARAGSDTRIDAVISLAELLRLPGASELQEAWLRALAGEHGYLAGVNAEVAACDAIISPVVTGHPDLSVVDAMIDLVLGFLDEAGQGAGLAPADPGPSGYAAQPGCGAPDASGDHPEERASRIRSRALSPEAWQALRYAIARLAVDLVSGRAPSAAQERRRRNVDSQLCSIVSISS